ncbi:MAG: hypothetical protein QOK21_2808 [Solirubrobacteraceae bacterium]|nr:hypothetical protein [Solirubrobacteraceae bacterium]
MITKAGPIVVQVLLLVYVAHDGTLADVGRLSIASATAYFCANFAEAGFATTLSVPRVYYGVDAPPLRATRMLRVGAGLAGTLIYLAIWAAGLGARDPLLLIVAPLPFAVSLSAGYAGVINASRRLELEGAVALGESLLTIIAAALVGLATNALEAALIAVAGGRVAGVAARALLVRRLPQSLAAHVPGVARTQAWFGLGTGATVIQGQVDVLLIGLVGTLTFAGVYGPLIRVPYGMLLLGEAVSWALFSTHQDPRGGPRPLRERVRGPAGLVPLGVVCGVAFAIGVQPFLTVLLGRSIDLSNWAILMFALLIVVRFTSFGLLVGIIRAGRQRDGVAVVFAAGVVLALGALPAAASSSLVGLAAARLASELVIVLGYLAVRRRGARAEQVLGGTGDLR